MNDPNIEGDPLTLRDELQPRKTYKNRSFPVSLDYYYEEERDYIDEDIDLEYLDPEYD